MDDHTSKSKDAILQAIQADPLAKVVRDMQIEAALDDEGYEFLRVTLAVDLTTDDDDEQLESLLERIEDAVAAVDDRYPSIRFLDAA